MAVVMSCMNFKHDHLCCLVLGDIAFDQTSGFWLVHSVPKFPPHLQDGYGYPDSGMMFGQSFLCITLDYKYFNVIGS